jgi:hypothetical protein
MCFAMTKLARFMLARPFYLTPVPPNRWTFIDAAIDRENNQRRHNECPTAVRAIVGKHLYSELYARLKDAKNVNDFKGCGGRGVRRNTLKPRIFRDIAISYPHFCPLAQARWRLASCS